MAKRARVGIVGGAIGLACACGPKIGEDSDGTEGATSSATTSTADSGIDDTSDSSVRRPFRDEWRVEADLDFVHTDAGGAPAIFDLIIGGTQTNDNFANRGDVIVSFDGPPNRILVELRRFTFTTSEAVAQLDYDDLSLWAFAAPLGRPQDQDPADDCVLGGWQNGCEIRVYYDGLSQLERAGADIRVTLPPDYRRQITVVTEDNDEEEDYLDRGNVCISNLHASASVQVDSGNVWVSLAPDATPAPTCTPAQIQACEDWTIDDGGVPVPAPWAPECDCIAVGGGLFGRLEVDNRVGTSSNVTVDAPSALWSAIRAENLDEAQDPTGDHCEAAVTVPGFEPGPVGNDFPWQAQGNVSYPGSPAISGAGYSVQLSSSRCSEVAFTADPADYVGLGNGAAQAVEERGNLQVCSGCIVQGCNALVP